MSPTKKIILSGSSSGIGRAIAERALALGYSVVGLARDHDKFRPVDGEYFPFFIDFSDMPSLEFQLGQLMALHADTEIVITCAGYGRFQHLEQFSTQQICHLMNVNFISQVLLVKTFLPLLKQRHAGKIIMIGSEAALQGERQGSIYCASKFAIRGFCQSLRKECQPANVGVSLINPGLVATPFFDSLHFSPGNSPSNSLTVQNVVNAVMLALQSPADCVFEEINLQPIKKAIRKKSVR